jgi:hypothetical protein
MRAFWDIVLYRLKSTDVSEVAVFILAAMRI